jgi:CheY-like chemotaxis protein
MARHPTQAEKRARDSKTASSAVSLDPTDSNGSNRGSVRALESEILQLKCDRDELLRRFAAIPPGMQHAAIQLSESSKAIQALRQARDAVMARASELTDKLNAAEDNVAELTDSHELALLERDAALERLNAAQDEFREIREKLNAVEAVQAKDNCDETKLSAEIMAKAKAQLAAIEAREDHAKDRHKASVAHLVEQFGEERRKLLKDLEEAKTKADVQISALQAQLAAHTKDSIPAAEAERHRLDVANLRVELEQLREELRLAKQPPPKAETNDTATVPEPPPQTALTPGDAQVLALLDSDDVNSELAAMDWYLAEIQKDVSRLEALDVLVSLFRDASERALSLGCMSVHRLAVACSDVASWLRKAPGKIAAGLPLLQEGRALLRRLVQTDAAVRIADPFGASVYAVDNDGDNCECIVMALEKATFHTRYATKPDVAFGDLAKGPVDLIILDVDLGETDGFDLHDLIRQIDHHQETPVIFVSGLLSTPQRLAGISGPPASFVAKPYNLNELVLKSLCAILTSRIARLESPAIAA